SYTYLMCYNLPYYLSFFFHDTSTSEIYTLSLHDALPILVSSPIDAGMETFIRHAFPLSIISFSNFFNCPISTGMSSRFSRQEISDRKSTRLNSSHRTISYAVFCLKKKKKQKTKI